MIAVRDTSIVGLVKEAIMSHAANNQALEKITLTEPEMTEFYKSKKVTKDVGAYFGSEENPIITNILGVKKEGDIPTSLWYMGVLIVRI